MEAWHDGKIISGGDSSLDSQWTRTDRGGPSGYPVGRYGLFSWIIVRQGYHKKDLIAWSNLGLASRGSIVAVDN